MLKSLRTASVVLLSLGGLSSAPLSVAISTPAAPSIGAERAPDASDNWLLVGERGGETLSLLDCPSGRRLSIATLPQPLAAEPVQDRLPGAEPRAVYAVLRSGEVLSFELPSLRRLHSRVLPLEPSQLAVSAVDSGLLAVGGNGAEPLRILDARTLSDAHVYRPVQPTVIGALAAVPGRSSFIAGLAEPAAPAEVWELALDRNAPPVLKGLVHDYRMGESVPLPGRFTPRVSAVASPTGAFVPGPMPYEWLRIDAAGNARVLHLDVRREIARLPGAQRSRWLAAAWQGQDRRGWLVGEEGAQVVQVFESVTWRLGHPIPLPGLLLAIRSFGDNRSVLIAVASGETTKLLALDVRGMGTVDAQSLPGAMTGVHLRASRDGQCIALIDESGNWLSAVAQPN